VPSFARILWTEEIYSETERDDDLSWQCAEISRICALKCYLSEEAEFKFIMY
jgi:hypothetical protein